MEATLAHRRPLRSDDDRGATLVWVALMTVVMLVFTAIAIDAGQAYASHRQSQNASDAGAMAGVRVLQHIKFDANCVTLGSPCPFDDRSDLAAAVLRQAQNSGADSSDGGVACYLIGFDKQRVSGDLCANGGTGFSNAELQAGYGVEAVARQTRQTSFARVIGFDSTRATTSAKALIEAYRGANASPFIVCGSRADDPDSYDILAKDTTTTPPTYSVKKPALLKYYVLQSSNTVPQCGATGSAFKGQAANQPIVINAWNNISTGNGNAPYIYDSVVGVVPCSDDDIAKGELRGCGLAIPIASQNRSSGANTESYLVMWTVWKAWGNGKGNFNFNTIGGSGQGEGCKNPFSATGNNTGMKYCGQLLGSLVMSGGGGDPTNPPQPGSGLVIHLVA